jgi:agmatinase
MTDWLTYCGVSASVDGRQPDGKGSDVAILGAPLDAFSTRRRGQSEAPGAIRRHEIFDSWRDPYTNVDYRELVKTVDCGDVEDSQVAPVSGYRGVQNRVGAMVSNTGLSIVMGGDHAVTAWALQGIVPVHKRLNVVHLDAHTDTWTDHPAPGTPDHSSWVDHVIQNDVVEQVHQFGVRSMGPQRERPGTYISITRHSDLANGPTPALRRMCDTVKSSPPSVSWYLSVDLDVVDPSAAPGVAYPEPGGWLPRTLLNGIHMLIATGRFVGMDVVELIPSRDVAELTTGLAHRAVLAGITGVGAFKNRQP